MRLVSSLVLQEHTVPGGRAMEMKLGLDNYSFIKDDIYVSRVLRIFFVSLKKPNVAVICENACFKRLKQCKNM